MSQHSHRRGGWSCACEAFDIFRSELAPRDRAASGLRRELCAGRSGGGLLTGQYLRSWQARLRSAEPIMSAASSPRLGPTDAPTTPAGPSRLSAATPGSRELSRTASRGASILEDGSLVRGRAESDGGAKKKSEKKLGMFKGVLVPTCENMWGVIIFLRFYKIVGYGGLGHTTRTSQPAQSARPPPHRPVFALLAGQNCATPNR